MTMTRTELAQAIFSGKSAYSSSTSSTSNKALASGTINSSTTVRLGTAVNDSVDGIVEVLLDGNESGNTAYFDTAASVSAGQRVKLIFYDSSNYVLYAIDSLVDDIDNMKSVIITNVDVQYALSSSNTTAPTTGWGTNALVPSADQYLWTRTATYTESSETPTYSTPSVLTTGQKDGATLTSVTEYYYLSTSATAQVSGSWVTACPTWESGKYIWTKSVFTWSDGTTTESTPALDAAAYGLTQLNAAVNAAQLAADEAKEIAEATNQHFWYDDNGAHVSYGDGIIDGYKNSLINANGFLIRDGTDVLASFGASSVKLGANSSSSVIDMCDGDFFISTNGSQVLLQSNKKSIHIVPMSGGTFSASAEYTALGGGIVNISGTMVEIDCGTSGNGVKFLNGPIYFGSTSHTIDEINALFNNSSSGTIGPNISVTGTIHSDGEMSTSSNLIASGALNVAGGSTLNGAVSVGSGGLSVKGGSVFSGTVTASSTITASGMIYGQAGLNVTNAMAYINQGISVKMNSSTEYFRADSNGVKFPNGPIYFGSTSHTIAEINALFNSSSSSGLAVEQCYSSSSGTNGSISSLGAPSTTQYLLIQSYYSGCSSYKNWSVATTGAYTTLQNVGTDRSSNIYLDYPIVYCSTSSISRYTAARVAFSSGNLSGANAKATCYCYITKVLAVYTS